MIAVPAFAADAKKGIVAGKVFDRDTTSVLKGVPVRIVNVDSGSATEVKTDKEGCYRFKSVPNGAYSVSVSTQKQDYLLPEKINVQSTDKPAAVTLCVALGEKDSLNMLPDCEVCKPFPIGYIVIGAAAAAIAGGIIVTRGEEVSKSNP